MVPPETLAAGRALVEFVDKPAASTFPDLAPYKRQQVITSATGQLKWDASGVVTIDTPGTQGMVGFAPGKPLKLANVTITSNCPYASILLTAEERTQTLAGAKRILLCALARNANTGFRCLTLDAKTIVDNGKGPTMLEPVQAQIAFPGRRIAQALLLDHDGRATTRTAQAQGDTLTIDGTRDQTLYYEVILE